MGYFYVLEFGGQHTDLIGNRLRDMGFDVRYAKSDAKVSELRDAAGIIISGGPKSVNNGYPHDPALFSSDVPILGICYGMQLISRHLGANIHRRTREYGETHLSILDDSDLFYGLGGDVVVWMNHGDSVESAGNFVVTAYTEKGVPAAMRSGNLYGVQFHPEVTHTENGKTILRNFAEKECGQTPKKMKEEGFDAGAFIDEAKYGMRQQIGGRDAVVYASGGVDSTVAAYLAKMAGARIIPVYLDMGNGRKNEAQNVSSMLSPLLDTDLCVHDVSRRFLSELRGVDDPEAKRKIFSKLYAGTREEVDTMFNLQNNALIQGTIATDRRESGKEAGKGGTKDSGTVDTIKTHHNVGAERHFTGLVVSPLQELTKERVRMVARELGLPPEIAQRQPFPGPGLFVRFATGYYPVDAQLAGNVSDIAHHYGLESAVLPRKGVGLKGDERAFEHAALLTGERDWQNIRYASKRLIEDSDISRVLYSPDDIALSQPRLDRAHKTWLNRKNMDRLREVTDVVERTMEEYGVKVSQTPVITFQGYGGFVNHVRNLFGDGLGWVNVVRDVQSEDFRTCRPLRKPDEFPWECYDEIDRRLRESLGDDAGITTFDISDKPGGTTEWE